ncbi:transcription factor Spi-C [Triplophysa dalaica]|uniref:transcription factor Spi-C n=1 Tax=Triplophysa dalaica TaxID=1582913 RepID=UPI0024DF7B4E|nr:transcription factor Spi-C [Triplophysa dalaica]
MGSLENDINQDFQDAIDVIQHHSLHYDTENKYFENLESQQSSVRHAISYYQFTPHFEPPGPAYDWNESSSWSHIVPDVSLGALSSTEPSAFYSNLPQRHSKGRKKLRLYEYLHEALHDDNMGDSIQWTDRGSGIFHFISKNKEKLAECWGQRKGNRKTMTYQKMARALRNYSRTGEIVKVRRKLTYQFNPAILQRLSSVSGYSSGPTSRELALHQQTSAEHVYYSSGVPDCHYWYGQYSYQSDYDLATVLTMHQDHKTTVPMKPSITFDP